MNLDEDDPLGWTAFFLIKNALWDSHVWHERGNPACTGCIYPLPDECICGGIIHYYDYDVAYDELTGDEWDWRSEYCDNCDSPQLK